ncbi:hypothetical protein NP233_g11057 [Leucocoprinus birnbaumii]|uniref:Cyanate hydratase n=1 Tax=Leucocoprinus birnbaumii TaxID=56174 RepID=A0AAD5VH50_9AGAR|nr:hypothetical protein NP233_g11057 [Leucocoprinus birnbaumii]
MSQAATVPSDNAPLSGLPPICSKLLEAKARKGLTFDQIAKSIDKDEVWVASGFYGQAKFTADQLKKISEVLEIPGAEALSQIGDHWWPNRGLGPMPPQDPVLYRLFESVLVYGTPIKAIIHEKFGDGIMSMIDCKVTVDRKPDPKGDRVVLTFDGKFLPYATCRCCATMFSRVSIEFETGSPTASSPPQVDDDDNAGDIGLQDLPSEEIDCAGYFPAAASASFPGAFSSTISSVRECKVQKIPSLPSPSPPRPLEQHPAEGPATSQHTRSPSQTLHASPSWALSGLCITGLESSSSGAITEENLARDEESDVNASISHEEYAPLCTTPSDHRQLDHHTSPNRSIQALHPVHIDDGIPDDFVGVLNVGYPLHPSKAHSDLAGLGLGLSIPFDSYPGEESVEMDMDVMTPDLTIFLEKSPALESTPSFLVGEEVTVGNVVGCFLNTRPLFVIAEEDDADWCSVDEEAASC